MGQKRSLVAMSSTFFEKGRKFFSKLSAETHGPVLVNKVQRPRTTSLQTSQAVL